MTASLHCPSRREVVKAALAAAGGLLSLDHSLAAERQRDLPRVVVVGAGFAGLACADELATAGYPVTVVEARDRVGVEQDRLRSASASRASSSDGRQH